jgi:adenosylhomocysteine nucleosidase
MKRIAIIAALERELEPFVRYWIRCTQIHEGKTFRCFQTCFENGEGVSGPDQGMYQLMAVACGIGCGNAELAARAMMAQFRPQMLISAGLAGALIPSLKVGNIVTPNVIVDAATAAEYRCQMGGDVQGDGLLVSAAEIAGKGAKELLAGRFHASIVDMEAAGVAKVAHEFNVRFRCVKSISDEVDFIMPPMGRFVDAEGRFRTRHFAAWAVLHPRSWSATVRLGRNSRRATRTLSDWLMNNLIGKIPQAAVVTLSKAEHSERTGHADHQQR